MTTGAILRAEILDGERVEVTCALEITEKNVFVVTERLPSVGDLVHVRLSFPRAIRPLLTSVSVVQVRLSSGPGALPGFVAEFDLESASTRSLVVELARRVRPAARTATDGGALSILMADENALVRDMFAYTARRYFEPRVAHLDVKLAGTSEEAIQAALRGTPDVVIVDHRLRPESGSSLIVTLRADARLRRTAIVATSVGGGDAGKPMLEAGADLFLRKPIALKELFSTLELLVEANRSERGAA